MLTAGLPTAKPAPRSEDSFTLLLKVCVHFYSRVLLVCLPKGVCNAASGGASGQPAWPATCLGTRCACMCASRIISDDSRPGVYCAEMR